jgi:hypothetical protein
MTRTNLAVDPSLRSGSTAAYAGLSGATLSVTEEYSWYGKYGLLVAKDATNGSGVRIASPVPVVAGESYAFAWYTRLPITIPTSEEAQLVMHVDWMNSLGAVISTETSATLSMDSDATWYRVGGVWTAPAGATFANVSLVQPLAGTMGATFIVDALLIEQASYVGGYFENIPQAEKNTIVQKGLSAVPQVINGVRLGADIVLNGLVFNTIDEDDTIWVITDIDGWWGQADPELPDIPRGTEDGSYDVEGRTKARSLSLSGFFIPKDPEASLSAAIDRLVLATNLTRQGGWLQTHEYPTKAAWVRLSSRPTVRTVNARGKTEFQINLRAGDPIKYHWNDQDPEGFTNLTFEASDSIGEAENIGTAHVTGLFTITGPAGAGTRIYNATTGEMMTLAQPLRGAGLIADAYEVEATDGVATIRTVAPNHLRVGDEIALYNMVIPFSETEQTRIVTAVSEVFPYSFSFEIPTDDIDPMSTGGQVRLVNDDVLIVDTYNRSVTYNGERSGHRSRLTTLTDWIHFAPGDNLIEFFDEVAQVEVVSKKLTSNTVTLVTNDTHYFIPGEEIEVALPEAVPLSKKRLTSNVVTLTTKEPHGFSVGDKVSVESIEASTVVTKSRASNVVTLTTQEPHGVSVSDSVVVALPTTAIPNQKSLTSNTATLSFQHAHGFSNGDSVVVALPTQAAITNKSLTANQATLTTASPHNFSVGDSITVALPTSATIVGKARSGAQIVITTASAHGFSVGDTVVMALPTTATLTGTVTANGTTNLVTVTTSGAHGFSVGDRIALSGLSVGRWNDTWVVESVPSSTAFTFRDYAATGSDSSGTGSASVLNLTNQSYNGTKTLISASGTTFAYNL